MESRPFAPCEGIEKSRPHPAVSAGTSTKAPALMECLRLPDLLDQRSRGGDRARSC